ncbi:LysM peptidoglycan-binding domain-containing protein [Archangium violaceum]|uniref:LysM peptidoglycan-binding domain-containing protein n=1 Tax=Archangium violaceum TaxID=83451 RepID=UPI002B28537F|nr:LysM peptidoglycan-binding domain-containing protein [Archangium violaceum]
MKIHTVQEGENLENIAGEYGYADWLELYTHPANAELRAKKPSPSHIEPGDTLKVPPPPSASAHKVATGGPVKVVIDKVHRGQLFWNRTWNYDDSTKPLAKPVKEFLPGAKVELHIQKKGAAALSLHASGHLSRNGEFSFKNVPECTQMALKIFLENRDRVTLIKGASNVAADADFEVKRGAVVWHQLTLDMSKVAKAGNDANFGEVEIKKPLFVDLCDTYKSIWTGHLRIKVLTGYNLHLCAVNYPSTTTSYHRAGELYLLKDDLKDRSVILHEYGHFIGNEVLGGLTHPGYGYNDDVTGQHSPTSKEHYESAWNEAHATFLACVMRSSPIYHDGYDTLLTLKLDTDNTKVGPHCESSIQDALWRVHAVHKVDFKTGFWKAFTTRSKRTVRTIFDLYDNWKELKCPGLDKLKEAYGKFNLEYGYRYTQRFALVKAPLKFDAKAKKFTKLDELYDAFGKTGGGTLADYKEEFYNRNKQFNAGSIPRGATLTTWTLIDGMSYIVPERFKIS